MWLSNKPHGEGIFKYKNGDVYRGEVEFGMKHGHGELLYRNGDCYTGSFVGDKREGSDGKLRVLPVRLLESVKILYYTFSFHALAVTDQYKIWCWLHIQRLLQRR